MMNEPRVNKRMEKEAAHRLRECLDEERTHVRVGPWINDPATPGETVTFIGYLRDLHGTVCTCCPKREGEETTP